MTDNKNPSDNKPHDFEEAFDFDAHDINEDANHDIKNLIDSDQSVMQNKEKSIFPVFIGLAIAGFIGWKIYGYMFTPNTDAQLDKVAAEESAAISASEKINKTLPAPVPAQIPAQTPPQAAAVANMPAPPTTYGPPVGVPAIPPPPATAPVMPAPLAPAVAEEMKHLENTVSQAVDTLTKMDQKMNLMAREFFSVSEQVAKLSQELADMKTRKAPVPAPVKKHIRKPVHRHKPQPVYHVDEVDAASESSESAASTKNDDKDFAPAVVKKTIRGHRKPDLIIHAIIPGRVWLRAPDGSTLTVTEGGMIPGYGKAMVIDAPSSTVVTSSGVVLR